MTTLQMIFGALLWVMYIILFFSVISYILFFRVGYKSKATVESVLGEDRWQPYAGRVKEEIDWFEGQEKREQLYILTRDKIRLSGWYLPTAAGERKGRVILMHDYRTPAALSFAGVLRAYHQGGYDVLLADQRAHGESYGKFICFGARERYDCKLWVECMNKLHGDEVPTYLHGVGMGGTAVLMTAGLKLPRNVVGVIAEGAHTSPYAFVKKLLRKSHTSAKVFMDHFDFWCRAMAGYKLKGASTQAALRETKLPVLLIHGTADAVAPYAMAEANCEACAGEKRLIAVPEAGHGVCLWAAESCGVDMLGFMAQHAALPEPVEEPEAPEEVAEPGAAPVEEAAEPAAEE